MTRYILTGPSLVGEVYADYSTAGELMRIDFTAAQLTPDQHWKLREFLPHFATSVAEVRASVGNKLAVTDSTIALSFEDFFSPYAHKINKKRAEGIWDKLTAPDKEKAVAGIAPYFRYLAGTGFRAKKDPDTYLRTRTWEDFLGNAPPAKKRTPPAQRSGDLSLQNLLENYATRNTQTENRNSHDGG